MSFLLQKAQENCQTNSQFIEALYAKSITMNFDDIEQIAPGVSDLSVDEHEALQKFTIVWSLFEAQVLDCDASVRKIVEKVEPLNIEGDWFQEELNYFIGRYIENGNTNHKLKGHPSQNVALLLGILPRCMGLVPCWSSM